MKIMLIAGEASGDYYGANLIKTIKELDPRIEFFGWGSQLMAKEGLRVIFDPTEVSTVGFVEVIKKLNFFKKWLERLEKVLVEEKPDCLVLIDFPGFNMRMAKIAHRLGIPCVYFIPPTAWAWGRGRAKKIAQSVDKVISILPMEMPVYQEAGADIIFVGHPLLDVIPQAIDRQKACEELGLNVEKPVLTILPGSRKQELDSFLPLMLEAVKSLKEKNNELQLVMGLAPTVDKVKIEEKCAAREIEIKILEGKTHEAIAASTACLCTGGTVTLETALLERPMVIVYRLSSLTFALVKLLVKVDFFTLPNLILQKRAVPELIQKDFTARNVELHLQPLLENAEPDSSVVSELKQVRARLGIGGAFKKTAQIIWEVASVAGSHNHK